MDEWEQFVYSLNTSNGISRDIVPKILEKAKAGLKDEPADFEIKSVIECIMKPPISILNVIVEHRSDEIWSASISDIFDFLSELVLEFSDYMEDYIGSIIKLSLVGSYSEMTCRHALNCLATICKLPLMVMSFCEGVVQTLLDIVNRTNISASCRAVVFHCLGNLCAYHPEIFLNDDICIDSVWRACLKTMEKNPSSTLFKAVLQCVEGIYKNYGDSLDTNEIRTMYKNIKNVMEKDISSQEACLTLLCRYARLHPELMRLDKHYLDCLWRYDNAKWRESASECAEIVYGAICTESDFKDMILKELWPHYGTKEPHKVSMFLRVLHALFQKFNNINDKTLLELRTKVVREATRHVCDALEKRIYEESIKVENSDWQYDVRLVANLELAQACVLYVNKNPEIQHICSLLVSSMKLCPSNRRRQLIAETLLKAANEDNSILHHLIDRTCHADGSDYDDLLELWNDIFDQKNDELYKRTTHKELLNIFNDVLVKTSLDMDKVFELYEIIFKFDDNATLPQDIFDNLERFHMEYGVSEGFINIMNMLCSNPDNKSKIKNIYARISFEYSADEKTSCAIAKLFINNHFEDMDTLVQSLEFVFTRNNIANDIFLLAISSIEKIPVKDCEIIEKYLPKISSFVSKCKLDVKNYRIARRNALLLISKFGKFEPNFDFNIDTKETTVDISRNMKLNIENIVKTAIKNENFSLLKDFILLTKSNDILICEILHKICLCLSRGDGNSDELYYLTLTAVKNSTNELSVVINVLDQVRTCKYPGGRKFLCAVLEVIFIGEMIECNVVLRPSIEMIIRNLSNGSDVHKMAAVDVLTSLLPFVKDNNQMVKENLPTLMIKLLKNTEYDFSETYQNIIALLKEKRSLFSEKELEKLIENIFKLLPNTMFNTKTIQSKVIKSSLDLLKCITVNTQNYLDTFITATLNSDSIAVLHIFNEFKMIVDPNVAILRNIIYNKESKSFEIFEKACMECVYSKDMFQFEVVYMFLNEYGDIILELFFLRTIELYVKILTLHPTNMLYSHETIIQNFYKSHTAKIHSLVSKKISEYTSQLDLTDITDILDTLLARDSVNTTLLKRLIFISKFVQICNVQKEEIYKWIPFIKRSIAITNDFNSNLLNFMNDVLHVSLWYMDQTDVVDLLCDSRKVFDEKIGLKCFKMFTKAFVSFVYENTNIIANARFSMMLPFILKDFIKVYNTLSYDRTVLNSIINEGWFSIEETLTVDEVKEVIQLLSNKNGVDADSEPAKWIIRTLENNDLSIKTHAMDLFPEIKGLKKSLAVDDAVKTFYDKLPLKLSELTDPKPVDSLFKAFVTSENDVLIKAVMKCCLNETEGWWHSIIERSVEMLAFKDCTSILNSIYTILLDNKDLMIEAKVRILEKLLLPILEYSRPSVTQEFFTKNLETLLQTIDRNRGNEKIPKFILQKDLTDYYISLSILRLLFVKMSSSVLEHSVSVLYSNLNKIKQDGKTWWILRRVGKNADALRRKMQMFDGADEVTKACFRKFHCASFNCLAAVLLKKDADPAKYTILFDKQMIIHIIDTSKIYRLPIKQRKTTKRHATVALSGQTVTSNLTYLSSLTCHKTSLFYNTLSDNVLQYDFCQQENDTDTVFIVLSENELNQHECAGTLPVIFKQLSSKLTDVSQPFWIEKVCDMLSSQLHDNVKMLIIQSVCNCYEDLRKYATHLVLPLLSFVENRIIDGLSINCIEVITKWCENDEIILDYSCKQSLHSYLSSMLDDFHIMERDNHNIVDIFASAAKLLHRSAELTICIQKYFNDTSNLTRVKAGLKLVKRIQDFLNPNENLFQNLRKILRSKIEGQSDFSAFKMAAEIYGRAFDSCQSEELKMAEAKKFNAVILPAFQTSKLDSYIDLLYIIQNVNANICDDNNIRIIIDASNKVPRDLRRKCIKILSAFVRCQKTSRSDIVSDIYATVNIEELLCSENYREAILDMIHAGQHFMEDSLKFRVINLVLDFTSNTLTSVRNGAYKVLVKFVQDQIQQSPEQPPFKRPKLENESQILKRFLCCEDLYLKRIISTLSNGLMDTEVFIEIFDGVKQMLSDDLGLRFCECIFLTSFAYADSKQSNSRTLHEDSGRMVAISKLLFENCEKDFEKTLLYEFVDSVNNSRNQVNPSASRILSCGSSYQGTLLSNTMNRRTRKRAKTTNKTDETKMRLNVKELMSDLIQACDNDTQISAQLYVTILKSMLQNATFSKTTLAKVLYACLTSKRLSKLVLVSCKYVLEECLLIDGFKEKLIDIKKQCVGTDLEILSNLIMEDVEIVQFDYDLYGEKCPSLIRMETERKEEFSLEALLSSFDKLSNWDTLTLEERIELKNDIPVLWTNQSNFCQELEMLQTKNDLTPSWFQAMSALLNDDQDTSILNLRLFQTNCIPIDYFGRSAIAEAIQWRDTKGNFDLAKYEHGSKDQCLAKRAARLMLRRQMASVLMSDDEDIMADVKIDTKDAELKWCRSALDIGITKPIIECIKRNASSFADDELLSWFSLHTRAKYMEAKENAQFTNYCGIYEHAEKYYEKHALNTNALDKAEMNLIMARIKVDICLRELERNDFDLSSNMECLEEISDRCADLSVRDTYASEINGNILIYYNALIDKGTMSLQNLWRSIRKHFKRILESNVKFYISSTIALLYQKVLENRSVDEVVEEFFDILEKSCVHIEDYLKNAFNQLHTDEAISKLSKYTIRKLTGDSCQKNDMSKYLTQLRVPNYSLRTYCEILMSALVEKDRLNWVKTFENIEKDFRDIEGSLYKLLKPYLDKLDSIKIWDPSKTSESRAELGEIIRNLTISIDSYTRDRISIVDLCPILARAIERDGDIIVFGERIAWIDKEVTVSASLRRPCVINMRRCDGTKVSYLLKCHDDLRNDSTAQIIKNHFSMVYEHGRSYKVIPLSDNFGVIEWIDNCQTVRSVIAKNYKLDDILRSAIAKRANDVELIKTPIQSCLNSFKDIRSKLPVNCLRSSIEKKCFDYEHFWKLRKNFQNCLAFNAIVDWILAISDRHLDNILYSQKDGSLISIDNSQVLFGSTSNPRVAELSPSRVTPALLAVCMKGLEARMQRILECFREISIHLNAVIHVAFLWRSNSETFQFQEKIKLAHRKLNGALLAHEATILELESSDLVDKKLYSEFMGGLFESTLNFDRVHTVDEQVSSILRQCTNEKLLSVTRSGWEPWI